MKIEIDIARLSAELETLAGFSDAPAPAVTRVVFSPADLRARTWLKTLYEDAGLTVREDGAGNTFARWEGADASLAAVGTGSHMDAIPHAGRYDGTVGVLGGLEAIRALKRAGFRPRSSIELLMFTSEEPTRFGIGCLGSRLLGGVLDPAAGDTLRDSEGKTLNEIRTAAGFSDALETVRLGAGAYSGFIELHIEQGPLLERRGVPIGVVTAIAAPASFDIAIEGSGGHAGAVLMGDRHDAFLAAAEIALALESAAKLTGSADSVATTGICEVFPGAVNSIPSRIRMTADIRDIDERRRDTMIDALQRAADDAEARRGVKVAVETVNRDAPATCDPRIVEALGEACRLQSASFDLMVSRAYHDSLFMSRICPTAMLFIPCRNGYSHRPDEYASPEAIELGTRVLAEALASLARTN